MDGHNAIVHALFMTNFQAARIRNLINTMARQLENETDPAKRLELKKAIRAGEIKLTTG